MRDGEKFLGKLSKWVERELEPVSTLQVWDESVVA